MTATHSLNHSGHRTTAVALRERALELLDFPAVRESVAGYTTFPPSRELAEGMVPSHDPSDVRVLQQETAEARQLLDKGLDLALPPDEGTPELVRRAALGGALSGTELLTVSELLEALYRVRRGVLQQREQAPLLGEMAEQIPDLREVSAEIGSAIGPQGAVLDGAAPGLGLLRRQVRSAFESVNQALEDIIRGSGAQSALQDQVVSVRSDRLVLQVKAEMRQRIPGIVHDASNTGATLYVEPFRTVELCNDWRELAMEESREVQRVLYRLSSMVGADSDDVVRGTRYAARLDFVSARARYGAAIDGITLSSETGVPDAKMTSVLELSGARHPLLGRDAVPIDLRIGPPWCVLTITGPNTGGKTVAMKTAGLLAQMHQSGLQVPAGEGSRLPVFDGVYADVGDRQSISESVSTFSSHMRNVIDIMSVATPSSLVLMDELGSSTDPEEGAALARAVLDHLADNGTPAIVTTHHRSVAAHAEADPRMMNASVDLNPETLSPTYRLTIGIAGRSYAMTVAASLGMDLEVMRNAESMLGPEFRQFDDSMDEIRRERARLQSLLDEADAARSEAEAARREYEARSQEIEVGRRLILDEVRGEINQRYADVRRKLRKVESALSWRPPGERRPAEPASAPQQEQEQEQKQDSKAASEMPAIRQEIDRIASEETAAAPPAAEQRPMAVGDLASVRGLDLRGKVEAILTDSGEAEIVIGSLRLKLDQSRLDLIQGEPPSLEGPDELEPGRTSPVPASPAGFIDASGGPAPRDLDIRGYRVEPALFELETFLQRAVSDGLTAVRVVHGHGTGALRTAVRDLLRGHSLVRTFRPEQPERGGNGVTTVALVDE